MKHRTKANIFKNYLLYNTYKHTQTNIGIEQFKHTQVRLINFLLYNTNKHVQYDFYVQKKAIFKPNIFKNLEFNSSNYKRNAMFREPNSTLPIQEVGHYQLN